MKTTGPFMSLLKQDLIVAHRNGLFIMIIAMALIFIALVQFALPEKLEVQAGQYIVDATEGKVVHKFFEATGQAGALIDSEEELKTRLRANRGAIGIVFTGNPENPGAVIHSQGTETQSAIKSAEAVIAMVWNHGGGLGRPIYHEPVMLRPQATKPPFNKSMVPVILSTEVIFLGLMFVSVMIFQEKNQRSIKAFRVSPAGTWAYIGSKVVTLVIMAVIYALIITMFTLGMRVDYGRILALIVAASLVTTCLGLATSVFFNSISDFLYVLMGIIMIVGMPVASYIFPAFRLSGFEYSPSYLLIFGLREIIFPTGKTGFFLPTIGLLAGQAGILLLMCKWAVDRTLMKEGR